MYIKMIPFDLVEVKEFEMKIITLQSKFGMLYIKKKELNQARNT